MLAFVAGVLAVQQLQALPRPWLIANIGVLALLLCLRRLRMPGCFLLGLCWAMSYASVRLDDTLLRHLERRDLLIEGLVVGLPQALNEGIRFDFRVSKHEGDDASPIPGLIRLNWYRTAPTMKAGEHWRLRVRLKRPHGFFNPGGLDYERWLFAHGIRATGYVHDDPVNIRMGADANTLSPQNWRQQLFDRLETRLAWTELRGIVEALTMGEEGEITPAQWEVLRRTGTAHLVAISGSHIGLIAGVCFLLVRWLCAAFGVRRLPPPSMAAGVATATAFAYSALADFAIPTQRALIMIAIVMGGVIGRRNMRPLHTLALALLAVTAYDPLAVLAPGFWLSFAAVALILFSVAGRLRPPGMWQGLWKMNWVTAFGLFPLLLLFFQQVSLISPVANFLAVPTMGMIAIPWCLLGTIALTLNESAGALVLSGVVYFLQGVWHVAGMDVRTALRPVEARTAAQLDPVVRRPRHHPATGAARHSRPLAGPGAAGSRSHDAVPEPRTGRDAIDPAGCGTGPFGGLANSSPHPGIRYRSKVQPEFRYRLSRSGTLSA